MCSRRSWTGNSGAVAGHSCGKPSASGIFDRVGDSRASSAARDSVTAGAGGCSDEGVATAGGREGNEAAGMGSGNGTASDAVMWVSLRSGYTSCMAVLKSCQSLGSSIVSRVMDQVSHEASSV